MPEPGPGDCGLLWGGAVFSISGGISTGLDEVGALLLLLDGSAADVVMVVDIFET